MNEAMAEVRRELGPDAIIISNFANENGRIEITAAVETSPTAASTAGREAEVEASLEQMLRNRLREPSGASGRAAAPVHSGIAFNETLVARALDMQGIPADLRDALVAAAAALDSDDAIVALARALETRLGFEPIPVAPRVPVMLVGLPGAGKTVTMTKLAAGAILDGASVDIITTDTARAGAAAQCEAYGHLLGVNARPAETVDALALLLEERAEAVAGWPDRSGHPCFIDTASVNPFDRVEYSALARLTDGARIVAGVEPVLVLSALGDATLLSEVAARFTGLGIRRLVATHVDISRRLGAVLAAADATRLSLAQISVTPYLARGLGSMNPQICARLILQAHEQRSDAASLAAAS
jgi:flagellar biosynthesis protein FlhF